MAPASAPRGRRVDLATERQRITERQNMSTVVKMLMIRDGFTSAPKFLAVYPIFKSAQSMYDRLNAAKEWEAGELRDLADIFAVDVSVFFEDPDTLIGGPNGGEAVTIGYPTRAPVRLLALAA